MKILHLGGLYCITNTVGTYQKEAGHEVHIRGVAPAETFFEVPWAFLDLTRHTSSIVKDGFNLVHCHLSESVCSFEPAETVQIEEALRSLHQSGIKFVYSTYGLDQIARVDQWPRLGVSPTLCRDIFSHLFIQSPDSEELTRVGCAWSWLPLALDLNALPTPLVSEPKPHEVTLLHIPYRVPPSDTSAIISCVNELKERKYKFNFVIVPPEEIQSLQAFRALVSSCDVYIERLTGSGCGPLALEALAQGKTTLSGNAITAHQFWPQLNVCPVLDTNRDNLKKRLESILREPKCLRDLGRRSRSYVEHVHDGKEVSQKMLEVYEQVIR